MTASMETALPCTAPARWQDREDRVGWCLTNLTRGELARLCELFLNTVVGSSAAPATRTLLVRMWREEADTCRP